ncbi:MAG: BMP family ABC transporter substrate-binding protein [Erysipelotrichaceae bacterium]|nr:BMP family ABC transporter substrate-binding protein [Erysipelotrichaceae bacterium]MBO4538553.1 BMP family ABC transporter substrate-binding protein [Erysipelotrichaceae bacterium]MBR5048043.1 BMP family ABC transporter substrate-binding protein [Erysipelotrichaceae bacterium]
MKKLLIALLALLLVFTATACKEKSPREKAKEAGKITVAYVVNGTLGDKSFFDSGNEGIQWINRDFGDKVYGEVIELTYETSTWKTGLEEVFKEGWDIIITGTYDMKEYIIPLIGEYPDQKIWFYDEEWNYDDANGWQYCPAPNLYAMLFAQNEGSFVVGAMAAMLSQAKKVAFMGGMDNTVLDDFFVGFANGAKYIDPEVKVNLSWMNSFNDASAGKDVSTGLYADGFDVVFACGGQAGLGGFDSVITQAEGNWIIGVDGDQGAYFASLGSDEGNKKAARTITSMKKNVNQGFYDAMKQHLAGTLPYGKNVKLGLNGGYVSYAITDTTKKVFSAEQLAQIDKIVADIISGAIDPGTAFGKDADWFPAFAEEVAK